MRGQGPFPHHNHQNIKGTMKRPHVTTGGMTVRLLLMLGLLLGSGLQAQAQEYKPFMLAYSATGTIASQLDSVRSKIARAGFEIVGEYSPYKGAMILVITNEALQQEAAKTEFGGYGAALRVTLTEANGGVQVAYTHPGYMAGAYRMDSDLAFATQALARELGAQEPYGMEGGMDKDDLNNYHYMFGMEYFDEPSELGSFSSHALAVMTVAMGLAAGNGGTSEVYRINIPGKREVLFGVALTQDCSGDEYIMSRIDFNTPRSTGHLPYEILVSGNEVYALYARFRIAVNFPDLAMAGSNSFFSIMCAPDAIEEALLEVTGQE